VLSKWCAPSEQQPLSMRTLFSRTLHEAKAD
jgi:hypothetical protein